MRTRALLLSLAALLAVGWTVPLAGSSALGNQGSSSESTTPGKAAGTTPIPPRGPDALPPPAAVVASAARDLTGTVSDCEATDPAVRADCIEAIRENYRYVRAALDHRRASFEWSLTASKFMFFVVLSLVFAGLLFAALQFRRGMRTTTEIEFSMSGVKVSSPVLGVVILAVSMAFFYLYARYVYPIQEVHSGEGGVVAVSAEQ